MNTTAKRITRATFKAFIAKNKEHLQIQVEGSFDGMTDCVEYSKDRTFRPVEAEPLHGAYTLGIKGAWLVGGGRDWFSAYSKNGMTGIHVSNSCGSFTVAVPEVVTCEM